MGHNLIDEFINLIYSNQRVQPMFLLPVIWPNTKSMSNGPTDYYGLKIDAKKNQIVFGFCSFEPFTWQTCMFSITIQLCNTSISEYGKYPNDVSTFI